MDSYEVWDRRLSEAATALGFNQGYKILFVPWNTIGTSDTVFLSLNPGRCPHDATPSSLSDERGNSYEIEEKTTISPLTKQFLALSDRISLKPLQIITGAIMPFRTVRWKDCSHEQRSAGLRIGKKFWKQVFDVRKPQRVIACGTEAAHTAVELLHAKLSLEIESGWGKTKLKKYLAPDGSHVIQFPHLSTFKLLSRPECDVPISRILTGC